MGILRTGVTLVAVFISVGAGPCFANPPEAAFTELQSEISQKKKIIDTPAQLNAFSDTFLERAPAVPGNQIEAGPGNPHDTSDVNPH